MAVFRHLALQGFASFLVSRDYPFQIVDLLLQALDGVDRLQQPLSQVLVACLECLLLLSEVLQFFICGHGATVADRHPSLQLHSPSE